MHQIKKSQGKYARFQASRRSPARWLSYDSDRLGCSIALDFKLEIDQRVMRIDKNEQDNVELCANKDSGAVARTEQPGRSHFQVAHNDLAEGSSGSQMAKGALPRSTTDHCFVSWVKKVLYCYNLRRGHRAAPSPASQLSSPR